MKPRVWCLLVGVLLVAGQAAAQAAQFGDFTYESSGTAVTVTGYSGSSGAVTIPDTIDGLRVTSIDHYDLRKGDFVETTAPPSRIRGIKIESTPELGNSTSPKGLRGGVPPVLMRRSETAVASLVLAADPRKLHSKSGLRRGCHTVCEENRACSQSPEGPTVRPPNPDVRCDQHRTETASVRTCRWWTHLEK